MRPMRKRTILSVLGVMAAVAIGGCGSAGGGAASAGTTSVKPFQQTMDQAFANLHLNKWNGPTQPVPPPKHLSVAIIECDATLGGCRVPAEGAAEAARKLGWSAQVLDGQGQSQRFNQLMSNAVAQGVNAIIADGIDPNLASQGLAAARAKGIPTISLSEGAAPSPKGFNIDISGNTSQLGTDLGSYVVAKSGGKANVLQLADNEYVTAMNQTNAFRKVMEKCGGCTLQPTMNFISSDVSTSLQGRLISYLQTHPGINWIDSPYDPAVTGAICPALQRAGLANKIKVVSMLGLQANLQLIQKQQCQVVDATWPQLWNGWAGVDQLIRILDKKPTFTPADENLPLVLLDREHMPPNGDYEGGNVDFRAHYLKLWGLS